MDPIWHRILARLDRSRSFSTLGAPRRTAAAYRKQWIASAVTVGVSAAASAAALLFGASMLVPTPPASDQDSSLSTRAHIADHRDGGPEAIVSPLALAALEHATRTAVYGVMYLLSSSNLIPCDDTAAVGQPAVRHRHCHHVGSKSRTSDFFIPPFLALVSTCTMSFVAATGTGQGSSATLASVLTMRAASLVFLVTATKSGIAPAFASTLVVICGACGSLAVTAFDPVSASGPIIAAVVGLSALGPWTTSRLEDDCQDESEDGSSWLWNKAKNGFLALMLLVNVANATNTPTPFFSQIAINRMSLGFIAATALSAILGSGFRSDSSKSNSLAMGSIAELARDALVTAFAGLFQVPTGVQFSCIPVLADVAGVALLAKFTARPASLAKVAAFDDKCYHSGPGPQRQELSVPLPSKLLSISPALLPFRLHLSNRLTRIAVSLCCVLVWIIGYSHLGPVDSSLVHSIPPSAVSAAHALPDPSSLSTSTEPNITLTLVVDPLFPGPIAETARSALPFEVHAAVESIPANSSASPDDTAPVTIQRWTAKVPPASTWPLRAYEGPPRTNLTLSDIVFSAGGNPTNLQRSVLACSTFAGVSDVDYTVMWAGEDDPDAMRGKKTDWVEAFYKVCGRYPVVMLGEPGRPEVSMHRKWFKQLAFQYETARSTTKWFAIGDDDTLWFPKTLIRYLRSLDVDPLVDSVYLGDYSESARQVNVAAGKFAYGGGGVVVSRALAARLASEYRFCIKNGKRPGYSGDVVMNACVELVSSTDGQGNNVTLTRVPLFNQMDLLEKDWASAGREYVSMRMSRVAPATLHHIEWMRPLVAGTPDVYLAAHTLWHNVNKLPVQLMFRRFMVHVKGAGTAVITFGYHVRLYQEQVTVAHLVDFDSAMTRDPEWLPIEVVLDDVKFAGKKEDEWPRQNTEYRDFWFYELDATRDAMVFIHEETGDKLALTCTSPDGKSGGNLHNMCGSVY